MSFLLHGCFLSLEIQFWILTLVTCSGDSVDAVSFPLGPFVVDMLSNHPLAVCKVYKPHIYIFCKMAWGIITNLKCQPTLIWGEGV